MRFAGELKQMSGYQPRSNREERRNNQVELGGEPVTATN